MRSTLSGRLTEVNAKPLLIQRLSHPVPGQYLTLVASIAKSALLGCLYRTAFQKPHLDPLFIAHVLKVIEVSFS